MTVRLGPFEFDHVVYDDVGDVLYLSLGEPREAADADTTPDGHVIRYDAAGDVIGITFVNAKWLHERDGELRISIPVPEADLTLALA